jgi:pyridoxal phosphate enzyme (YggS family)
MGAQLMIVTKKQSISRIHECIQAGAKLFGENRVQEVLDKWPEILQSLRPEIRDEISLHFIGHLQTNKVHAIVPLIDTIQSVDSVKLAKKISDACIAANKIMNIFLEVNITGEKQKYGFSPNELSSVIQEVAKLENLKLVGLMCMTKLGASETEVRKTFRTCKKLADELHLKQISMGMSDDFSIAVEEGSTLVRLGRVIFEHNFEF